MLLKNHQNTLFKAIKGYGFNTEEFESQIESGGKKDYVELSKPPVEMENSPTFIIHYKQSPFRFKTRCSKHSYEIFAVDYNLFIPRSPLKGWSQEIHGIDELVEEFKNWLKNDLNSFLKEKKTPDLWSHADSYKSIVNNLSISQEDTSFFSKQEKRDVRGSVEVFKKLVEENFQLDLEQTKHINEQLNYLSDAVERLNRFDWRGLAISIVMSIAANLCVDTEKGKLLFDLFRQAINSTTKLLP